MAVEIRIPTLGESISEVVIAKWLKNDGDFVKKDEPVVELETDKTNTELPATDSGRLSTKAKEGDTLSIGDVIGAIEPGDAPANGAQSGKAEEKKPAEKVAAAPAEKSESGEAAQVRASSLAKKVAAEHGVTLDEVKGRGQGGRITKEDVLDHVGQKKQAPAAQQEAKPAAATPAPRPAVPAGERAVSRERMTQLRKRIAARLVESQQSTATLTTFNEADMTAVMELRKRYNEAVQKKHGIKLGLMSFFVKAAIEALKLIPRVNASIEGDEIVYHHYYDIGIAVGTERGLVVPIIRNAEKLSFVEIELQIKEYAEKARAGKLSLDELQGGTFTVSNGGVYGSMLSTPILNPPQSGILGMHNIVDRPVAINGQVVIRPIMYLAFSYDHRIIDGTESVTFLKRIKECIEAPERMMLEV